MDFKYLLHFSLRQSSIKQIKYIFLKDRFCIVSLLLILFLSGCTPVIKKEKEIKSPEIRVLLNQVSEKDSLFFKGNYRLISEEAEYEFGVQNNKIYIVPSESSLLLYNDFRYLEYQKTKIIQLIASSKESQFVYNDRTYFGNITFAQSSDSAVQIINELSIEEYLRGVVPAEIYVNSVENYAATKAQTICARTYAINQMQTNQNRNFDVFCDTRDQVYRGADVYQQNSDKAIKETRGIILTFNNQPALIYYHSTCGGQLEPVQNVFGEKPIEYLAGGSDAVSDVFSCSASTKFRWSETRSIEQLDSSLQKYYNIRILPDSNQIKDTLEINLNISIISRTETGRVNQLKITTADTSVILNRFEIRKFFGKPSGNFLASNLFYLSQENDSTITIKGGGFGHGVGMCQWGAMNMAQRGFKYYHILNKYFPGTLLTKGY